MSKQLDGVIFTATFIDQQTESDLVNKVRSLGGEFHHKMDASVTFLVVGKRYTKKYDFALTHGIKLISAETFFAIYVRWRGGDDIDVLTELTSACLKPFEGELICLSNLDSQQKDGFHELIVAGGGQFSIAFARVNSVLVSPKATGRKIDGARKWGTPVVHPKWISDSVKFGAALNPERYNITNPNAEMEPPEVTAAKPAKMPTLNGDAAAGEEHASAPVLKRRRGGDLLFNAPLAKRDRTSVGQSIASFAGPPLMDSASELQKRVAKDKLAIFKGMRFSFRGFNRRQVGILRKAVKSLEGSLADDENSDDFAAMPEYCVLNSSSNTTNYEYPPINPSGNTTKQNSRDIEPPSPRIITEWAIERSMYLKENRLEDIWGIPVRNQPASGFEGMALCISGFEGIEQRHATLLVKMLGAAFHDTLKAERDILIAAHQGAHKVPYAVSWGIPVVSIDWLWQCATEGKVLAIDETHALDGKGARPLPKPKESHHEQQEDHSSETAAAAAAAPDMYGLYGNEDDSSVSYRDDDAAARAQVLISLGEEPARELPAEPEIQPATSTISSRRRMHTH